MRVNQRQGVKFQTNKELNQLMENYSCTPYSIESKLFYSTYSPPTNSSNKSTNKSSKPVTTK